LEQVGLRVLTLYDAQAEDAAGPGPEMGRVLVVARRE